jgi:hypothetical protein
MDQGILVDSEIDEGETLIAELSQRGFDVTAACWLKAIDKDSWSLFVASTVVDELGPLGSYRLLNETMDEIPGLRIDSMRVKLIEASSATATAIAEIRDRYPTLSGIEIGARWLGRFAVDRGYIYPPVTSATRATPPASPLPRAT